jgi:hypothetical protein
VNGSAQHVARREMWNTEFLDDPLMSCLLDAKATLFRTETSAIIAAVHCIRDHSNGLLNNQATDRLIGK